MAGNDGAYARLGHRLKGIVSKHRLRYRNTINVLDAVPGDPTHPWKRGDKMHAPSASALNHPLELGSDIAPQRGIGLLYNHAGTVLDAPFHNLPYAARRLLHIQVAGFRIDRENGCFRFEPAEVFTPAATRQHVHSIRGEWNGAVKRTGQVIGN